MSQLHVLLIGVDYYAPNVLEGGISYGSLAGCVRDVQHVEQFLRGQWGESPATLRTLMAARSPQGAPLAPNGDTPTYANIVKALQEIVEIAQPGDRVLIHYAGHGGRTRTAYPELKGENGIDEALVPTDIGAPDGRYLRDVELAYLLMQFKDAGLLVTVTLDSCHSGGSLRGETDMMVRGGQGIDTADRPTDSLVASHAELVAGWRAAAGGDGQPDATRAAKSASNWLLEPQGYVLLAACRSAESAYEFAFNGRERNGALTYWLLDTLRTAGAGITYKLLHERVYAKVNSHFVNQTPVLEGEGDLPFLGLERQASVWTVPVIQVDPLGQRVRLNAGDAHGIRPGAAFHIYPLQAGEHVDPLQRTGVVEVSAVEDVHSWATILEQVDTQPIAQGDRAVLATPVDVRLQRRVGLGALESADLRATVAAALQAHGDRYLTMADTPHDLDFQVGVREDGACGPVVYEILDAAGQPLPNLRPALPVDAADSPARLVQRLVHLARYRAVQELDMPDPYLFGQLAVSLAHKTPADSQAAGPVADPAADRAAIQAEEQLTPVFRIDDEVVLRIQNRLPRTELNQATHDLNITVLLLEADWSITQIFPADFRQFESVSPGQELAPEFRLAFPDIYAQDDQVDHVVDTIKVFATQRGTNFRWLELPPLDQPEAPRQATRSGVADPLEQTLAAVAEARPGERSMRPTSSSSQGRGWTVVQQVLRIARSNK